MLLKQYSLKMLRSAGLISTVDTIRFYMSRYSSANGNREFLNRNPDFIPPPLWLMYDAYANCNFNIYFESGLAHATVFSSAISHYLPEKSLAICEWGCGPGRIIRHVQNLLPQTTRLIGTDYNPETVEWCQKSVAGIEFILNDLAPPIQLEPESLDVVCCLSVFTHLSEPMHYAWIAELWRLLKPGGVFLGTFQGSNYERKLLPDELELYKQGKIVVRSDVTEGSRMYSAFHSDQFVDNSLLKAFPFREIYAQPTIPQTLWAAVK